MNFSQRMGLKPATKPFQKDSMDWELRNSLWNAFDLIILPLVKREYWLGQSDIRSGLSGVLFVNIWVHFFKWRVDTLHTNPGLAVKAIKDWYFDEQRAPWNEVYEFVEFVGRMASGFEDQAEEFRKSCNQILEREFSTYRFVGDTLSPITSQAEIDAIEQATSTDTGPLATVGTHIKQALELLSDRKNPDYRNSMKESISAVEGLCKIIAKNPKATLGPALDAIKTKVKLHPRLEEGLKALYGYTSDDHGIRHALKDDAEPEAEDATFFLVTCSAFVNYLTEKANKNGLV